MAIATDNHAFDFYKGSTLEIARESELHVLSSSRLQKADMMEVRQTFIFLYLIKSWSIPSAYAPSVIAHSTIILSVSPPGDQQIVSA